MAFYPYLYFGGDCREAFTRYQEIFGGEVTLITAADMPPEDQMPGTEPDLIMHAVLSVDGNLLMASDDPGSEGAHTVQGMQVSVSVSEVTEAKRLFTALAEGGTVSLEIAPTSWSPMFGMCTDRFGTPWMISAEPSTA
jgi:PhnB protein